jgi:hypothetical protein
MTESNSDQPNPDNGMKLDVDDLDWMAFCYIADELDGAQRAQFEARLENDELAQQAVVDAVGQAQVLYSSLNSTSFNDGREPVALAARPIDAQQGSFKRSRALFATAAALLMLFAGWAWFSNANTSDPETLVASESDRLAAAWIDTLAVMSDEELDDFIEEETPTTDLIEEESDNWMLLALTDLEDSEGIEREAN